MIRLPEKRGHIVSYSKWGYLFLVPFFAAFLIFQLVPLISTIYYSFFEYYRSGLKIIGPNFVGLQNYKTILGGDFFRYLGNTLLLWVLGFLPQLVASLLLAAWFTDLRLKLNASLCFDSSCIRVFDLSHLGHKVRLFDDCRPSLASGKNQMQRRWLLFEQLRERFLCGCVRLP